MNTTNASRTVFTSGPSLRIAGLIVLAAVQLTAVARAADWYAFTINPAASGFDGNLSVEALTAGTLIGNFDLDTNPRGTRTKPGLFGPFGDQENVPVPVSINTDFGGPVVSSTAGSLNLQVNTANGTVQLSGYQADLLAGGPVVLPTTLTLLYDHFRTRNPDSVYIGGIPLPLPLGGTDLTALSAQQVPGSAVGTLAPIGPDTYAYTVAALATLTGMLSGLQGDVEIPGVPVPLLLQGELTLLGDTAHLTSTQVFGFQDALDLGIELPQIPFDLPTLLPPGNTAHLLLNLTLSSITTDIGGTITLSADGLLIPEPATLTLLALAVPLIRRRCAAHRTSHGRKR